MRALNLEKIEVDHMVARVLEMRVNRGLGIKMFKKRDLFPLTRRDQFDEQEKINKHKLKKAA